MTGDQPRWHLKGSVVVACNCDFGCPCNFNARPTQGHCEGGWTWHIDDGVHDGISLSGLSFALYCDWPGAIHEGNGVAASLIDDLADPDQRDTIEHFLRGEIGGPWGILRNTFTTFHEPEYVRFVVSIDDQRSTVSAGATLDLATEPVRNPVTGVETLPRVSLPQGFIFKEGALLTSSKFQVKSRVAYDHSGKYAAVGPFSYQ